MQKLLKAVLIARQSAVRYASKQRSAAPISTDMKFTSELHKEIKKNEKFNSVSVHAVCDQISDYYALIC